MMVAKAISVVLFLLIIVLVIYLILMKREIKMVGKNLKETRDSGYNSQIRISLIDKDLSDTVSEMNRNLDFQKDLKLEQRRNEEQLKQSISDIAHDLRTPLTVVKGNLQLLEKEDDLSEQGRNYLKVCMDKTDQLRVMVDEFFELSVLESEKDYVNITEIDLSKFLVEFIIDHEAVIRQNDLEPEIIIPEHHVKVHADEDMFSRICSNLLNNIIKYAEGSFSLRLLDEENEVRVIFANPLLKEQDFDPEKLFVRSYKGDKARRGNGTGLGLYIVKLLAEKQDASVCAKKQDGELAIEVIFKKSDEN